MNLRLALAGFGLVSCAVLAGVLGWAGYPPAAVALGLLALAALIDLVVIQRRRQQRRRVEGGADHSLFE